MQYIIYFQYIFHQYRLFFAPVNQEHGMTPELYVDDSLMSPFQRQRVFVVDLTLSERHPAG